MSMPNPGDLGITEEEVLAFELKAEIGDMRNEAIEAGDTASLVELDYLEELALGALKNVHNDEPEEGEAAK